MSIWNDCEETNSMPFYGFPIQMKIKENALLVNFPKGYEHDKKKVKEIANKLSYLLGEIEEIKDNSFKIKLNDDKLANFIYHAQFKFRYSEDDIYKISIDSWNF